MSGFPILTYFNFRIRGQKTEKNKLWRLLKYSVTIEAKDFSFGMQESFMRVDEHLEFNKVNDIYVWA